MLENNPNTLSCLGLAFDQGPGWNDLWFFWPALNKMSVGWLMLDLSQKYCIVTLLELDLQYAVLRSPARGWCAAVLPGMRPCMAR